MSDDRLRIFLPTFSVTFGVVCFFGRAILFRRKTGKNPIIPGSPSTPHGFVGLMISFVQLFMAADMFIFVFAPETYVRIMSPFSWFGAGPLRTTGVGMMLAALLITALAQSQMGLSWRVGIATKEKTDIVRHGFYRFTRNPIYLGMMLVAAGVFLVLPDPLMLVILVQSWTVLQILVRLEEQHMRSLHGAEFDQFCRQVPRWILWK